MSEPTPAFARDRRTRAYYERRAREYDDWYEGRGLFAARSRPGWPEELGRLVALVSGLPPVRTLDVACGTGYLTRHLAGPVVATDVSPGMTAIARERLPAVAVVRSDALALPFADRSFRRLFAAHFYGHLAGQERAAFLAEAARVAGELVVVDSARRPDVPAEQWQERVLADGSRHRVFKRYLRPEELAAELGGQVLMAGRWFVAARSGP